MLKKNTSSQIVQQMTLITEADNSSSTLDMGKIWIKYISSTIQNKISLHHKFPKILRYLCWRFKTRFVLGVLFTLGMLNLAP